MPPVPAIPPYIIEPIFEQFSALLPERTTDHPLGCHKPRIPDRVDFEKRVQILVIGRAYERIADGFCSESTLRRHRDEWIELGPVEERLRLLVLEAYERFIGLDLSEVAVDCCITEAPCGGERAGRNPVYRGKAGLKRSTAVDARGIPVGRVTAPAGRHDSLLLVPTLEAARALGMVAEGEGVHLDRGYGPETTRERLRGRGLVAEVSTKGRPAPLSATGRWVVERTNSWQNARKKPVRCTERRGRVVDFWVALSDVVVIVGRLVREGWTRYRWEGRPSRRP